MSAFYDLASLVVVPSGYKASKVYAQKPLTTDGQLTFSRASVATRVNASGLIEEVASNVPRLDYLGSTCPKLNLEPQRTNTQIQSEGFVNWLGIDNVTLTANTTDTTAPTGANTATKVVIGSGAPIRIYEYTGSSAGSGTISLFVKAGTTSVISLFTSSASLSVYYDLSSQVVTPTTGTGTITSYSNGWYRITATATLGSNEVLQILFPGSNGQTIYIFGAQCEAGAYATSYIPTTSAAVTRLADFANKGSISSLFGATEGTFFCELTYTEVNSIPIFLQSSVSSSFNQATYLQFGGNKVTYNVYSGGTQQVGITSTSNFTEGQALKIAVVYKANDFVMYINGVNEGNDTAGSISISLSAIQVGRWDDAGATFQYFGKVSQVLLFKTRLTNAQLAELTTL